MCMKFESESLKHFLIHFQYLFHVLLMWTCWCFLVLPCTMLSINYKLCQNWLRTCFSAPCILKFLACFHLLIIQLIFNYRITLIIVYQFSGAMNTTFHRLLDEDSRSPGTFQHYFRMSQELYEKLNGLIHPIISKQNTHMRKSISSRTRLAITLRYLASGCSMADLHYEFNVGKFKLLYSFNRYIALLSSW